jgi:hypothetical protein
MLSLEIFFKPEYWKLRPRIFRDAEQVCLYWLFFGITLDLY